MQAKLDFPHLNCEQCEENYNIDGIEPDCDNCELPLLCPANQRAWELYQAINNQFVHDFHALPLVFEIFGIQATRAEAREILEKLITIHGLITDHARPKQSTDNP